MYASQNWRAFLALKENLYSACVCFGFVYDGQLSTPELRRRGEDDPRGVLGNLTRLYARTFLLEIRRKKHLANANEKVKYFVLRYELYKHFCVKTYCE